MKVTGIIAEYNPFHKGHKYQIETLRREHHPDYVIVAMSGDFVQRGTPALMDKYQRAHMALLQGADVVFELPSYFATASAETFARGGILLFHTTGLTDSVCFGAESHNLSRLQTLAKLLKEEPDWYRTALSSYMKEGLSYPAARAKALPEYADILDTPNNILAVEYLKSMETVDPALTPFLIPRSGSGYHSTDLTAPMTSASAIRTAIFSDSSREVPSAFTQALPESSLDVLKEYGKDSAFLQEKDFSLLLHHALLMQTPESLLKYEDMTEALANRFLQQRNAFLSWSDFCERCKTKEITYARISRVLTHILLNIKKSDLAPYTRGDIDTLPYLRVLGFKQSAAPLLTELKKQAKAPVITSLADAAERLQPQGLAMLQADIYASDLYRSVLTEKTGCSYPGEYRRKLLVVE